MKKLKSHYLKLEIIEEVVRATVCVDEANNTIPVGDYYINGGSLLMTEIAEVLYSMSPEITVEKVENVSLAELTHIRSDGKSYDGPYTLKQFIGIYGKSQDGTPQDFDPMI